MTNPFFALASGVALLLLWAAFRLFRLRAREIKTAREHVRRAKREAAEIAELPLNNPYPLIQVDENGAVLFANPAAARCFPGLEDQGFDHPVLAELKQHVQSEMSVDREVSVDDRVYHQTIARARSHGQTAYVVYCYDITERKSYERNLKKAHQEAQAARAAAEKANQARGDFLANMSHELRTPMNGVIGLTDILNEADLRAEHAEMVEAVNGSARNLLILLNDILDFSKIEAGELSIEAIPFDLQKIIKQIESLQKPVAARKGLSLTSSVKESVPTYLVGDPSRLQQILNNLVSNALKFTEKGSVSLIADGENAGGGRFNLRIAVADTGVGISKDNQKKVFAKFQQADASTARKYGGTGLGLAITKDLAQLMGGDITLKSALGEGSVFTVAIPAKIAAGPIQSPDAQPGASQPVLMDVNAKILAVDDHPINLLYLRRTLLRLGFENFDEAASGKEAVALFEKNAHDLILLDCQMPEMDGFEAARRIRRLEAAGNRPAIIAVTADAMKGAAEKCAAAGMDDYVSKPCDQEKLRALFQRWLPGKAERENVDANGHGGRFRADVIVEESNAPLLFDWEHLHELSDGSEEDEAFLIETFMQHLETDIDRLNRSFHRQDYEEWGAAVHKLYGASSNIGASSLAAACEAAQSLSPTDRRQVERVHQVILQIHNQVRKFLARCRPN